MGAFLRGLIRGADPMEPDGEDLAEMAAPEEVDLEGADPTGADLEGGDAWMPF